MWLLLNTESAIKHFFAYQNTNKKEGKTKRRLRPEEKKIKENKQTKREKRK